MKINNKRVQKKFSVIYLLTLLVFIISILDNEISGRYSNFITKEHILILVGVISLMLFWLGMPLFNYDSDGEVLVIESSEPVLISRITRKHFISEFPKVKLYDFKIKELLLSKTLYLYLRGKKKETVLKTSVSYLNAKELLLLKRSLNKVLKNNISLS